MRIRLSPLLLAFAAATPACSFLLDFDELTDGGATPQGVGGESGGGVGESGHSGEPATTAGEAGRDAPNAGGGGETGGQPGEAGSGGEGGVPCATDCDDDNP